MHLILNSNLQVRGLESGVVVPLTSMAAHAVDEEVDIDLEINNEVKEPRESTKEAASGGLPFFPPPPPPPIREFNHSRVSNFSKFHNFSSVLLQNCRFLEVVCKYLRKKFTFHFSRSIYRY